MLKVDRLCTQYTDAGGRVVKAAHGVTFEVPQGEFFTLLGPSGCGKTTTLRCVAGLEEPDEGEIRVGDELVFSSNSGAWVPPHRRNIGMVFQSYAIWPHMNVFENAAHDFPQRVGYRVAEAEAKVETFRARNGLIGSGGAANHTPRDLAPHDRREGDSGQLREGQESHVAHRRVQENGGSRQQPRGRGVSARRPHAPRRRLPARPRRSW